VKCDAPVARWITPEIGDLYPIVTPGA
jgi:hypothetical protein